MMKNDRALSLEQQFQLRVYRDEIAQMSQEQAQHYIVELIEQMMRKDNLLKNLFTRSA